MRLLNVGFLTAVSSNVSLACTCAQPADIKTAIEQSEYVFLAETTSANIEKDWWSGKNELVIGFDRVVVWKGEVLPFSRIRTPPDEGGCGFAITVPAQYWFFVDGDGFFTMCGRTMLSNSEAAFPLNVMASSKITEVRRQE